MDRLDAASAAFLNSSGLAKASPMGMGLYRIEPVGKVGSVRTSTVQLDVRPKDRLGLSRLLFLLSYAGNQGFRNDSVAAAEDRDLWSALAESLAQLTERALGRGVLQGYLTVDESLRTVKGRIRISDQISRRPGMLVPLEVSYDEFTEDIAENRILRAALDRMGKVPGVRPEVLSRLRQLKGKLDAVTRLPSGAPLPPWSPSRMNVRYHAVLRLAELILRNASAEAGEGKQQTASFVVDMAQVFGDFVGAALRAGHGGVPGGAAAAVQRAAQRGSARRRPALRAPGRGAPAGRPPGGGLRRKVQGRLGRGRVPVLRTITRCSPTARP